MQAESLLLAERLGLPATDIEDPDYGTLRIECIKVAFADREYRSGDTNFVDAGMDELLSPRTWAHARQATIRPELRRPIGADLVLVDLLPPPATSAPGQPLDTSS